MKKRILFITPDFYPNSTGFANASINLINSIIEYGSEKYDVHVFTMECLKNKPEFTGISVIRFTEKGKNKLSRIILERKKIKIVSEYIKNNRIDIIFFETNTFPYLQNAIVKEFPNKVVVRIHSTADTEVPIFGEKKSIGLKNASRLMKEFMKEAPTILATSNYYLEFIKNSYFDNNVYTIWNNKSYGILYNTSTPVEVSNQNTEGNIFLTMGKMSENGLTQKGMTDLLKAIYYLKSSNELPSDFKLKIIGNGTMLRYIQEMIERLEIAQYCEIIESASHDRVFEIMDESKAIILLSRYEGQSMFITESISKGKPLIITSDNGMGDMIENGVNGFSVKIGDVEAAAQAIKRMIKLNKADLEKMGMESKRIYDDKFAPQRVYQQFDILMTLKD
ncbi:MAG: glycosyltransferase [Hominisplanchenecus sp.]